MGELKYPAGEIVWVGYYNRRDELCFILTSRPSREQYFLYGLADGVFKRLGKAKEPPELIEKYRVIKAIQN